MRDTTPPPPRPSPSFANLGFLQPIPLIFPSGKIAYSGFSPSPNPFSLSLALFSHLHLSLHIPYCLFLSFHSLPSPFSLSLHPLLSHPTISYPPPTPINTHAHTIRLTHIPPHIPWCWWQRDRPYDLPLEEALSELD